MAKIHLESEEPLPEKANEVTAVFASGRKIEKRESK
jgi:hypothetical protein